MRSGLDSFGIDCSLGLLFAAGSDDLKFNESRQGSELTERKCGY